MGELVRYTCEISPGVDLYLTVVLGAVSRMPIEELIFNSMRDIAVRGGNKAVIAVPLSEESRIDLIERFSLSSGKSFHVNH